MWKTPFLLKTINDVKMIISQCLGFCCRVVGTFICLLSLSQTIVAMVFEVLSKSRLTFIHNPLKNKGNWFFTTNSLLCFVVPLGLEPRTT